MKSYLYKTQSTNKVESQYLLGNFKQTIFFHFKFNLITKRERIDYILKLKKKANLKNNSKNNSSHLH